MLRYVNTTFMADIISLFTKNADIVAQRQSLNAKQVLSEKRRVASALSRLVWSSPDICEDKYSQAMDLLEEYRQLDFEGALDQARLCLDNSPKNSSIVSVAVDYISSRVDHLADRARRNEYLKYCTLYEQEPAKKESFSKRLRESLEETTRRDPETAIKSLHLCMQIPAARKPEDLMDIVEFGLSHAFMARVLNPDIMTTYGDCIDRRNLGKRLLDNAVDQDQVDRAAEFLRQCEPSLVLQTKPGGPSSG